MSASESYIKVEDLRVQANGTEILKGISLEARRGEILSIIGPAGAGKTTFLRCINRMAELDLDLDVSGEILLDGKSIYDRNVAMLRRQVGMVFSVRPTADDGLRKPDLWDPARIGIPQQ
jgi:ABC-type phosphate transport system ATPase subunit